MEKIWKFFETMNEYVYVTDIDTDELVYMNRKLRVAYNVMEKDYLHKKCYEVLQNCSERCKTCNSRDLTAGFFKEWECYNPVLDKYLKIKNTLLEDGERRYRVEIAIDITASGNHREMLDDYQSLELNVYAGLKVAMQAASADKSIDIALEYLGKALNGERTYVFEKNEKGGDDNTYEWVANGIKAEKDNLQDLPPEICAHWYKTFQEDRNILIGNLEDIREEDPLQYENLKAQDIHSLVVVPLYDEGKVIGFYGVDNPPRMSLDYVSNILQIMGYFIVSFIHRRQMDKHLHDMSLYDNLTGLGNRYAMDEYNKKIKADESLGVVYCDITGLKRVNDTEGHLSGDRLIIRAAECLKRTFEGYGMFRVGGDELLVLCRGIGEAELEEKTKQLRLATQKNDVVLALGYFWEANGAPNIDSILVKAEEFMYMDKAEYYKRMGIDRREN